MTRTNCLFFVLLSATLFAECPSQTNTHWAQYSTVWFSLGNIDPNSSEGKQIVAASVAWNNADVNNNNSGVTFYQWSASNPNAPSQPQWTLNNGADTTTGRQAVGPQPDRGYS